MLTDESIKYVKTDIKGTALVWVIDGRCLYDLPLNKQYADIFLNADSVIDISNQHTEHSGITLQFKKENEILEEFQTSEYFGSILLSNPQVLDLSLYPGGNSIISPKSIFDGEKFLTAELE